MGWQDVWVEITFYSSLVLVSVPSVCEIPTESCNSCRGDQGESGESRAKAGGSGTGWGAAADPSPREGLCCWLRQPWAGRARSCQAVPLCARGAGCLHIPPVPYQEHPWAPGAAFQGGGKASGGAGRSTGDAGGPGCARAPSQAGSKGLL